MKTARAFRSLFAAGILKSVMGKDRSRDASPKRLQRLAPPAAAWAPVHYHAINPADLIVEERLPLAGANGMVHRVAPQS